WRGVDRGGLAAHTVLLAGYAQRRGRMPVDHHPLGGDDRRTGCRRDLADPGDDRSLASPRGLGRLDGALARRVLDRRPRGLPVGAFPLTSTGEMFTPATIPAGGPMSASPCLVTGGTGLLGSHIAERLAARGDRVRALVRPGSDTRFLESLRVELVRGDLTDPAACAEAVRGVGVVYHSAAKVGDWGTWAEVQAGCLDATAHLANPA